MNTNSTANLGTHALLDIQSYASELACDSQWLEIQLTTAANLAGATILSSHFHSFGEHAGVTGVLILSESHISIHTWPENQYVAIDVFMCGEQKIKVAIDYLAAIFQPAKISTRICNRGQQ